MKKRMRDTNTQEEIVLGFNCITFAEPTVTEQQLNIMVNDVSWHESHVDYLVGEQKDVPFPKEVRSLFVGCCWLWSHCACDQGMDFNAWANAVFLR
jgi:hypothetical protein